MQTVASTALKLIASMKRDWIQTGRRPSGICAGALFIGAHAHGYERSMEQILVVVKGVAKSTVNKRLEVS